MLCAFLFAPACSKDVPSAFHGVKLGMRPDDVRARFDLPGGHWQNDGGTGGSGLKLTWQRDAKSGSGLDHATFEFHNGLLVAVRGAFVAPTDDTWLSGGKRAETPSTVVARDLDGPQKNVRWIAKDCPEHEAEVRSILGR